MWADFGMVSQAKEGRTTAGADGAWMPNPDGARREVKANTRSCTQPSGPTPTPVALHPRARPRPRTLDESGQVRQHRLRCARTRAEHPQVGHEGGEGVGRDGGGGAREGLGESQRGGEGVY